MRLLFHAELSQQQALLRLLFFLGFPVKSFSTCSDQLAETSMDEDVSVLGGACTETAQLVFSKDWKR